MSTVPEMFGSNVFDERVMKARLSEKTYKALKQTIRKGQPLDPSIANAVASAMRDWAVEKGATHYTHWFQPLTGITAEKHDSFISPSPDGGVIMEFSGKELIKGEPDASSFPSGGIRATFEARGYTAWDPTSFAFIKGKTLCIPTAFCAYSGESLDKKTPLLRSMEAMNVQALRVLKLFGNEDVKRVTTSVGPEQEYFLIDREMYDKRPDLIFTGRTLFGAKPPKGQELDDHYFGVIKPRVQAFMNELNEELWKLGVLAKTEHNEVAPAQHELAPIYATTNVAADHNQLTMELMQTIAGRHGMVCLLHEKPFAGVNGSGKHNNWSIATDTGVNLLSPGDTPYENAQFLLFLVAVIKAVDDYQDLLRFSVASAGNDHRLGANEAPPAVISIFLGDELNGILEAIKNDTPYMGVEKSVMKLGVDTLPKFTIDTTDRNRTSPFAFTGNKFEFRMVGSSESISECNVILNGATAQVLEEFADILEKADDFESALHDLIKQTIIDHANIVFNGDGYDDSWIKVATEERGLKNYRTTPDVIPTILADKNIKMLTHQKIYSEVELRARHDIAYGSYVRVLNIEAGTMVDMVRKLILPAIQEYSADVASEAVSKKDLVPTLSCKAETKLVEKLSGLADIIDERCDVLEKSIVDIAGIDSEKEIAETFRDTIIPQMNELRAAVDEAEVITSREYWPYPSYGELLFGLY